MLNCLCKNREISSLDRTVNHIFSVNQSIIKP